MAAVKALDGYRMDKAHTLTVSRLSDFESYMRTPDTLEEPEKPAFQQKVCIHVCVRGI